MRAGRLLESSEETSCVRMKERRGLGFSDTPMWSGRRWGGSGWLDRFWGVSSLPGGGAGLVPQPLDLPKDSRQLACPAAPPSPLPLLIAELNMGWRPVQEIILSHIEGGMLNKKRVSKQTTFALPNHPGGPGGIFQKWRKGLQEFWPTCLCQAV